ncbi:HrpD6 family protein [Xanthomonas graminis]|jgi:hypothetical protein|uniref:Uncharacterized protein n=1 Tax=Xanthomonas graminis pv. graminis TaxID=134874 RepID=A0A1M4JFT4_9XANT|nr:HrpD6 family protein [Xanthomonas translucens]EKU26020.1 type III secretory pathway component [Xanthomonas translucens pv. graminis ART-Xtg29]OAX62461.1 hypothetical protein A6R72_09455 [Xanthomonas translucens pv. graminis]UKE53510.1 hypothetical protein KFS84_14455 [Xanthomonas translucens pv. graminis]WIH07828.1 hypothetical protein KM579_15025 [Xanthomonas translucens pv. graminis]WIH13414.1 hypothetical protein KM563_06990 [Xanthomonas translucens pv. graminis]
MFETFDSSIGNDLNKLLETRREDPSGQRLDRAIAALRDAAEQANQYRISAADAHERSQAQVLREGLLAAAQVVTQVREADADA